MDPSGNLPIGTNTSRQAPARMDTTTPNTTGIMPPPRRSGLSNFDGHDLEDWLEQYESLANVNRISEANMVMGMRNYVDNNNPWELKDYVRVERPIVPRSGLGRIESGTANTEGRSLYYLNVTDGLQCTGRRLCTLLMNIN
jgi:hypothetical protein